MEENKILCKKDLSIVHDLMSSSFSDLSQRSLEIFKEIVEAYVETGDPVGSRTVSRRLQTHLSPATIRNTMADLEEAGLLYAPHTSAGRLPTEAGLRFFVNGLLQVGSIGDSEKEQMETRCRTSGKSLTDVLEEAISTLSGLAKCAGIVMAPKNDFSLKYVEFVPLSPLRVLLVMVSQDGFVENRILEFDTPVPPPLLKEVSNYVNERLGGRTLIEARKLIEQEVAAHQTDLDHLSAEIIEKGLGAWVPSQGSLIIKGQAHLLTDLSQEADIEEIRILLEGLETKKVVKSLLDASIQADGVQIFIGAENPLFISSGCSLVIAPYHNAEEKIMGAIGVVGPSRMNYGKIIPLVDFTARLVTRVLG